MSKNVIFFVHGVGRHAKGWTDIEGGPVHELRQVARQYECFNGLALDQLLDIVEIRYDDIFDAHLKQWADLADSLKTTPVQSAAFNRVLKLLSELDDDSNLFALYGGDVILYTAFDLIARRIRLKVNTVISQKISSVLSAARNRPGPNPEFSIVGHSLGTTIVHDCLQQLAINDWLPNDGVHSADVSLTPTQKSHLAELMHDPANNPFAVGNFIWDSVMMISNTSRLLHRTGANPYRSLVQPGQAVRYFFNIDHQLDPISKVKRFHIPSSWNRSRALRVEVDHIHDVNIHGYAHYLRRPAVHRLLFRTLVPEFSNSCNDHALQLEQDFVKIGGTVADKQAEIEQKLEGLKAQYRSEAIPKYRELIEKLNRFSGRL